MANKWIVTHLFEGEEVITDKLGVSDFNDFEIQESLEQVAAFGLLACAFEATDNGVPYKQMRLRGGWEPFHLPPVELR